MEGVLGSQGIDCVRGKGSFLGSPPSGLTILDLRELEVVTTVKLASRLEVPGYLRHLPPPALCSPDAGEG